MQPIPGGLNIEQSVLKMFHKVEVMQETKCNELLANTKVLLRKFVCITTA